MEKIKFLFDKKELIKRNKIINKDDKMNLFFFEKNSEIENNI